MAKQKAAKVNSPQQKSELKLSEKSLMFILGAIAFLLFANTLGHEYALDDVAVITRNKFVQKGIAGWPDIFSSFYWQGFWDLNTGLYRPLSLAMFALEWQLAPNSTFLFHLNNVLLYSVSAIFLFKLLVKLLPNVNQWVLFFTTLLFIVHPLHTEVVANIKSRDELLCFLFFILTTWVVSNDKFQGLKYLLMSSLVYLLALFSKEAAITFIPVFVLILYFFKGFDWKQSAIRVAPLAVIAVIWLGIRYYVTQVIGPPMVKLTYIDNSIIGCGDFFSRTATAIAIAGKYLMKCFVPFDLAYDYSYNQIPCETFASLSVIISLSIFSALIYLAWKYRLTKPVISFGILFFFITFSLSSNIVINIGTTMADRLVYIPSFGILLAFVFALAEIAKLSRMTYIYICIGIAALFSLKTFARNKDWKSDVTLYLADIKTSPESNRVNYNYATALLGNLPTDETQKQAQVNEIIKYLNKALSIDRNDKNSYANLAVAYYKMKDYKNSISSSRKAISFSKRDYSLYSNLADALFMNQQYDSALYYFKLCTDKNIVNDYTYNFIGVSYFSKREYKNAILNFEKGISLYPNYAETWFNYGNALAIDGQLIKAIAAFEKAYSLNPTNKQALYFIGMSYENMGNKVKANEYYLLSKN
jgi:tetratricopeptide (TPR) repeat protein